MMRLFPAPDPINGRGLKHEIEAAGYTEVDGVLVGNRVRILARTAAGTKPTDADWGAIGTIVAAHTGEPTPEQAAENEVRDKARQAYERLGELLDIGPGNWTASQAKECAALNARINRYFLRNAFG